MSFKDAVESIPAIAPGHRSGLGALSAAERQSVKAADTRRLSGSVDIDACLAASHPNANRWDYAVGYNEKAYFIEFHPAASSEVSTIIAKANWLKNWLRNDGSPLRGIKADAPLYWIPTSAVDIRGGNYRARLAEAGVAVARPVGIPTK